MSAAKAAAENKGALRRKTQGPSTELGSHRCHSSVLHRNIRAAPRWRLIFDHLVPIRHLFSLPSGSFAAPQRAPSTSSSKLFRKQERSPPPHAPSPYHLCIRQPSEPLFDPSRQRFIRYTYWRVVLWLPHQILDVLVLQRPKPCPCLSKDETAHQCRVGTLARGDVMQPFCVFAASM